MFWLDGCPRSALRASDAFPRADYSDLVTREEAHLRTEAKFANLARAKEQKDRAMKGWLGTPPPPSRTSVPGEEHKWYLMMGAAHFLPLAPRYATGRPPLS